MSKRLYKLLGVLLLSLILLKILYWIYSGGWQSNVSRVHATARTSEQDIREQLLSFTPIGSSGKDVLTFVLDSMRPSKPPDAHWQYLDALQAERTRPIRAYTDDRPEQLAALPFPAPGPPPRTIYLLIGEYPHRWVTASVVAIWTFDSHDKLVDLTVERMMGPPPWAEM